MRVVLFLVSLVVFTSVSAHASSFACQGLFEDPVFQSDRVGELHSLQSGPGFVVPNEKNIGRDSANFSKITNGLYVTVGTERGFMSAALGGPHSTGLVLVDIDARVVLFNRINKALLAIAKNRADYLHLRLHGSFDEIQSRVGARDTVLSFENAETLSDVAAWRWWTERVQRASSWDSFHHENTQFFEGANYLFDDRLFTVVSELARKNRIFVLHTSLVAPELITRLRSISERLGQKISVVDFSNAWDYIGANQTNALMRNLEPMMAVDSQWIFTYQARSKTGETEFKYQFASRDDLQKDASVFLMLGNLMRMDPSRAPSAGSRVRFHLREP